MPIAKKKSLTDEEKLFKYFKDWFSSYMYMRKGIDTSKIPLLNNYMLDAYMQGRKDERNQ
jgi:hypothetical protein